VQAAPKRSASTLTLSFYFALPKSSAGLFFVSIALHQKNTHPCKTLYLRIQKTGNAPRVPKSTEVATCLFHIHLLRAPSLHSQGGSRPPNYALSKTKSLFLRSC